MTNYDCIPWPGAGSAQGERTDSACAVRPQCCAPLPPTPAASFPPDADPLNDIGMNKETQSRAAGRLRGAV